MKLVDFVCFEATIPELQARNRDGVITELVSALEKADRLNGCKGKDITSSVIKRENEASTGMGKGVAVPHVKHKAIRNVVAAVGLSGTGVDFLSLDKQPVYSIILLISPADSPDKHLQAMECVFKHIQQEKFRKFLRQCRNIKQVEELIREADEDLYL